MLKPLLPEWRYWPAVALGILILLAIYGASLPPLRAKPYDTPESSPAECTTHECREDSAADSLAFYTALLAWFTGALVVTAAVQGFFLLRADKTARISAEAAKQSADALTATERAQIFITGVSHGIAPRDIRRPGEYIGRHPLSVSYNIINYGKTPAFIKEVRVGIKRSNSDLPDDAWADEERQIIEKEVLATGDTTAEFGMHARDPDDTMTDEAGDALMAGAVSVYFFGHIDYEDVFGADREVQFCWRWHKGRFSKWGGQKHNYRT